MKKIVLLFGGPSAEHEVSVKSVKNVYDAVDKNLFSVQLIGITQTKKWRIVSKEEFDAISLLGNFSDVQDAMLSIPEQVIQTLIQSYAVFPVLHGPYGEDGTVQGFLKALGVPFVGPSVLGSGLAMDKSIVKKVLTQSSVAMAKGTTINSWNSNPSYEELVKQLGTTLFIKPANMGSSVGVHKVTNNDEYVKAVADAFQYDNVLLVEEAIVGKEIECAVLGNLGSMRASVPGWIAPKNHEFYSYESKYLDADGYAMVIPAPLSDEVQKQVQTIAVTVCELLMCEGLSRVDCFVTEDEKVFVNEINTLPGFTNISMYPKMWEASGISYGDLITQLIELAVARAVRDAKIKTTRI